MLELRAFILQNTADPDNLTTRDCHNSIYGKGADCKTGLRIAVGLPVIAIFSLF